MEAINKTNIPSEYIISLQGIMNRGVFECFKCNTKHTHRKSEYWVIEDVLGFADSQWGKMVVWQCKECGQIYFFHLRENEPITPFDYVAFYHQYKTTGSWKF